MVRWTVSTNEIMNKKMHEKEYCSLFTYVVMCCFDLLPSTCSIVHLFDCLFVYLVCIFLFVSRSLSACLGLLSFEVLFTNCVHVCSLSPSDKRTHRDRRKR